MKKSPTTCLFLVTLVLANSQFGFYRIIDIGLHHLVEHLSEDYRESREQRDHSHDEESVHSHQSESHHHDERNNSSKTDHDTNTHDHSDELNFYSSHAQFLTFNDIAIVFFNTAQDYSDHFLLFPMTYDHKERIPRPPRLV